MLYIYLADLVVVLHSLFVLFVVLGGFFVLRWPGLAWFHIPVVFWGVAIEFFGWICPLTHLEALLRQKGGITAFNSRGSGFVEHYIMPVLYPDSLTRKMQFYIGGAVLLLNFAVYFVFWQRMRRGAAGRTE